MPNLDPTLLPALDAIYSVLGERPAARHYAPQPQVDSEDYHVTCFRRLCERDAAVRELMAEREEEPADHDPRSMEQWFMDEQCPSDASFR